LPALDYPRQSPFTNSEPAFAFTGNRRAADVVAAANVGKRFPAAEARQALEKAIPVAPALLDVYVRNRVRWPRPEDHIHMLEGLCKVGLDEE
jgi:hypothetical protein